MTHVALDMLRSVIGTNPDALAIADELDAELPREGQGSDAMERSAAVAFTSDVVGLSPKTALAL
jgi:hypothetical protein